MFNDSGPQIVIGLHGGWLALLLNRRCGTRGRAVKAIADAPAADMTRDLMRDTHRCRTADLGKGVEQPGLFDEPYVLTRN